LSRKSETRASRTANPICLNVVNAMQNQHPVLDDPKFIALENALMGFNSFEVLGIDGSETRNSNILAWLMDENGSHGLGRLFLREFFDTLSCARLEANERFSIFRERDYVDILLVSETRCIVIENKIFTEDHSNQLERYRESIRQNFPEKLLEFIYLTPHGSAPKSRSERPHWKLGAHSELIAKMIEIQEVWSRSDAAIFLVDFIDSMLTSVLKTGKKHELARELAEEWTSIFSYSASATSIIKAEQQSQIKAFQFITKYHVTPPKGSGFFSRDYPYRDAFAAAFKDFGIDVVKANAKQSTYLTLMISKTDQYEHIPSALTLRYYEKLDCIKLVGYIQPKNKQMLWNKHREILINNLDTLLMQLGQSQKRAAGKHHVSYFSREIEFKITDYPIENLNEMIKQWLENKQVIENYRTITSVMNKVLAGQQLIKDTAQNIKCSSNGR
jgi:hypothetical protein